MKRKVSLVILSLFLIACAGLAFAQPPGGRGQGGGPGGGPGGRGPGGGPMGGGPPGMMMGGGPGMMMGGPGMGALFSDEGRKDIGLSDKQVEDIQTIFRDTMRPGPDNMPTPPPPGATEAQRQEFQRQMQQQMQQRLNETMKKVEGVMTKDQLEKAKARSFQAGGGFSSLGNPFAPFAQAALNITEAQKTKIQGFQQEMGDKMRDFMDKNGPPKPIQEMTPEERQQFFQEMQPKMQQFMETNRKEMETKVQGILTDEQKKQGEKLIAETPEYIKKALEAGPPGPMNRAGGPPQGPGGGYRPGANSWQPGQGAPPGAGETPERRFPVRQQRNNNN